MKYITEMELRQLYKDRPFDQYTLPEAAKLTPGARQFLVDRRIPTVSAKAQGLTSNSCGAANTMRLLRRLEHTEAKLLWVAWNMSQAGDGSLAVGIDGLSKELRQLRKAIVEERCPEPISFWGTDEDSLKCQADAVAADPAWLALTGDSGQTEILLHYVRTAIGDLEPLVWDLQEQNQGCPDIWLSIADRLLSLMGVVCIMIGTRREVRNGKHEFSL